MTWICLCHRIYCIWILGASQDYKNIKGNKFIHRLQYFILKRYLNYFTVNLYLKKLKLTREFGRLVKTVKMNSVLALLSFDKDYCIVLSIFANKRIRL